MLHRPVEGQIKTITLRRASTGKWYVSVSVETEAQPLPETPVAVGADVGLSSFPYYAWANREPGAMLVWLQAAPAAAGAR